MNGNFCTVEMMIFLPLSMNLRRSPECSACPTVAATWANCLIVSRICLSSTRRSVTTMMESKHRRRPSAEADELVRQPGNGVALAAAGRVLDQVALARTVLPGVGQELSHHVELVVAREDLHCASSSPGLLVLLLDDLGVVLEDVGQPCRREDALPEVVGLEAVRDLADCLRRRCSPG